MAQTRKKAVARKKPTAVATSNESFAEFAGAGLENVTSKDLLVPRLGILQALSPQVSPTKPEFIEGASIGQIADLGTGELYEGEIHFLPVFYSKVYLEWAPRNTGKGLVSIHHDSSVMDECERNENGQYVNALGNYISETAQFFGLNLSAEGRRCFIPMTSTQLKKGRKWLTQATGEKLERPDGTSFIPPLFYRSYNLTTVLESNNEGEWYGWRIDRAEALPDIKGWQDIMPQAIAFQKSLLEGESKADVASMDENKTARTTEEAM